MSGDWMLMAHGTLNLVYDHQSGARGDDKAFASGMLMGMARRPLGNGTLQLKAMLSPDPLMGKRGYPLLLASGETANGRDRLIDRQHPHDFFMELSALGLAEHRAEKQLVRLCRPSRRTGVRATCFHAPRGDHGFARSADHASLARLHPHHASAWSPPDWCSIGVKIEASRFNAREPDQHRWNIETGPLDSTAIRVSWNPRRTLSLQGSWGHFTDPEQLEPGVDQKRWSASALWADEIAPGWKAAATLAWGRKSGARPQGRRRRRRSFAEARVSGRCSDAARRPRIASSPMSRTGRHFASGRLSVGGVRDFRIADHASFGAGGLFSLNFVPDGLAPLYGGHNPHGRDGLRPTEARMNAV